MYNHLYTIPACDRRIDRWTDGRTSCYNIVHTMHTRHAVNINQESNKFNNNNLLISFKTKVDFGLVKDKTTPENV